MAMRTITLKLYKPGARKKQIIEEAMLNYSMAYQYLLDMACDDIERIQRDYRDGKGRYRTTGIARWVDKDLAKELNKFCIEPFKDSLIMDFGMTMAGYLALKEVQADTGFPVAYVSPDRWEHEYNDIFTAFERGTKSGDSFDRNISKLSKKSTTLKPLFFCRYDIKRDYCLLYDEKNNRYYVKLYLMNAKSTGRKAINRKNDRILRYIYKDGKELEISGRRERFILVPLSFGKWQEAYLKKALDSPSILKTARLSKKGSDYFLAISFDIDDAETVKTETYLGLSRGIKNVLNCTVVSREGITADRSCIKYEDIALVKRRPDSTIKEENNSLSDNYLHKLANIVVEKAAASKAQVIVESLADRGDRLQWPDKDGKVYYPAISCHAYNRIVEILDYKLPGAGLPSPVRVSPVGIFYTCPGCGFRSKDNRFSEDILICITCGTAANVESTGSLNLSKKLIQYKRDSLRIKVKRTSGSVKFINEDLGLEFTLSGKNDFIHEFEAEIARIAEDFKANMYKNKKDKSFRKKYSLLKKLEECDNFSDIINLEM